MLLDLLAIATVLSGWLIARRAVSSRVWYVLMPPADQPPRASDRPWPPSRRMNRYISQGLDEIDDFLTRKGQAVE